MFGMIAAGIGLASGIASVAGKFSAAKKAEQDAETRDRRAQERLDSLYGPMAEKATKQASDRAMHAQLSQAGAGGSAGSQASLQRAAMQSAPGAQAQAQLAGHQIAGNYAQQGLGEVEATQEADAADMASTFGQRQTALDQIGAMAGGGQQAGMLSGAASVMSDKRTKEFNRQVGHTIAPPDMIMSDERSKQQVQALLAKNQQLRGQMLQRLTPEEIQQGRQQPPPGMGDLRPEVAAVRHQREMALGRPDTGPGGYARRDPMYPRGEVPGFARGASRLAPRSYAPRGTYSQARQGIRDAANETYEYNRDPEFYSDRLRSTGGFKPGVGYATQFRYENPGAKSGAQVLRDQAAERERWRTTQDPTGRATAQAEQQAQGAAGAMERSRRAYGAYQQRQAEDQAAHEALGRFSPGERAEFQGMVMDPTSEAVKEGFLATLGKGKKPTTRKAAPRKAAPKKAAAAKKAAPAKSKGEPITTYAPEIAGFAPGPAYRDKAMAADEGVPASIAREPAAARPAPVRPGMGTYAGRPRPTGPYRDDPASAAVKDWWGGVMDRWRNPQFVEPGQRKGEAPRPKDAPEFLDQEKALIWDQVDKGLISLEEADRRTAALNQPGSDERMKKNVFGQAATDMVEEAPGYQYEYKDEFLGAPGTEPGLQYGVMAQDLEKTPMGRTVVDEGPDGMKRVDTGRLSMANTGALNEILERLDRLENGGKKGKRA